MNKRKQISLRDRFAVFDRDGFTWRYCGASAPEVRLHVDHVKPVASGGTNAFDNLVTACADCNLGKSAFTLTPVMENSRNYAVAGKLVDYASENWGRELTPNRVGAIVSHALMECEPEDLIAIAQISRSLDEALARWTKYADYPEDMWAPKFAELGIQ